MSWTRIFGSGAAANPHPLFKSRGAVQFVIDLNNPHEEVGLAQTPRGLLAIAKRFGRTIAIFKPSSSQLKKIRSGRGKINVTDKQIAQANLMQGSVGY